MDYPKISVAVAVLNEEGHIQECIRSILGQSYEGDIEIIISDGGSTDGTIEIVKMMAAENENIILLHNEKGSQAAGRNIAFKHSDSDFVVYIDGHSYADENWLKELHAAFSKLRSGKSKIAGVGSVYYPAGRHGFSNAVHAAFKSPMAGAGKSHFLNAWELSRTENAYACLYDKNILEEVGLYNENFKTAEDMELNQRLTARGYEIYVNPEAITYYYRETSLWQIMPRQFRYGFWRMKLMKFQQNYNIKVLTPAVFLLAMLFLAISSFFSVSALTGLLIVMFLYLAADLSASLFLSFKEAANPFYIAFIIPAIHIGYGAGTICGLFSPNPGKER